MHRLLLVREDDVPMEGLYHQQRLTECSRALAQHLVWFHGDDGAESKDERVNVLHVQVVCSHCVRHRVIGQALRRGRRPSYTSTMSGQATYLWIFTGQMTHLLWIQLNRVIAQLGLANPKCLHQLHTHTTHVHTTHAHTTHAHTTHAHTTHTHLRGCLEILATHW